MNKFNQQGFSLPTVLVILALIGANTLYFMDINKNSTATNQRVATTIDESNEKSRLSAYLADQDVCGNAASPINFYNKDITLLFSSIGFPLARSGNNFLTVGGTYIRNTHKVTRYYLYADPANANSQTRYSLYVNYDLTNPGATSKNTLVKIPLFIELTGNIITRCYARSDQSTAPMAAGTTNVELAIANACQGNTAYQIKSGANILGCQHNVTAQNCPIGKQSLNGMVPDALNAQTFTCSATTYACPTAAPTQLFGLNLVGDGTAICSTPDPNCGGGSTMIKNGAGISCSQNCPATYLWSSIAVNGAVTCYERLKPCPAGKYTSEVHPDGTVSCGDIIYKSVDCGAGSFATDLDSTSVADPLKCAGYSKVKTCSGGIYVTSFTTATPSCVTYTF